MPHQKWLLLLTLTLFISNRWSSTLHCFETHESHIDEGNCETYPLAFIVDPLIPNSTTKSLRSNTLSLTVSCHENRLLGYEQRFSQNQLKDFSATTRSGASQNLKVAQSQRKSSIHRMKEFVESADGIDWFEGDE